MWRPTYRHRASNTINQLWKPTMDFLLGSNLMAVLQAVGWCKLALKLNKKWNKCEVGVFLDHLYLGYQNKFGRFVYWLLWHRIVNAPNCICHELNVIGGNLRNDFQAKTFIWKMISKARRDLRLTYVLVVVRKTWLLLSIPKSFAIAPDSKTTNSQG